METIPFYFSYLKESPIQPTLFRQYSDQAQKGTTQKRRRRRNDISNLKKGVSSGHIDLFYTPLESY